MIRHVIMLKLHEFADGCDKPTNALRVKALMEAMLGNVNGLHALEVGINQLSGSQAFDVVLLTTLESWEALEAYRVHPLHLEVVELLKKVRSDRVVVDFEIEA
jgi:hypothetical protein